MVDNVYYCGTGCTLRHTHLFETENETQKEMKKMRESRAVSDFFQEKRNNEIKQHWKKHQYAKLKYG